jgi:hypothetical protein
VLGLPGGFGYSGELPAICQLAKSEAGESKFADKGTGAACEAAPISQTSAGRIAREFCQFALGSVKLFIADAGIGEGGFEDGTLFGVLGYEAFAFLVALNH